MGLSLSLSKEEIRLAESYAELNSMTIEEAFENALFEKIEDEYDRACAEIAYKEYLEDPETISHAELKLNVGHRGDVYKK